MNEKEKLLGFLTQQAKIPYFPEEIAVMLGASDRLSDVNLLLEELCSEGTVIKSKKGRYEAAIHQNVSAGTYRHNPKGFGFVTNIDGDFFIPPDSTNGAFNGDKVLVKLQNSKKHEREGVIIRIMERANQTVTGIYESGYVLPTDSSLDMKLKLTPADKKLEGARLIVRVTDYEKLTCELLVNLGSAKETESALLAIMHNHGIPFSFPEEVTAAAEKFLDNAEAFLEGRKDYRDLLTITIDGASARDLDDAISVFKNENGYILYVHIADVSEFVRHNSILDNEAFKRGTSSYFPDRVTPMLPEALSNGICSLHPGVSRLAVTTKMEIDKNGTVVAYDISESVIKSDFRMTYDDVTELLENEGSPLWDKYKALSDLLFAAKELAEALRVHRFEKGAIDFNITEPEIIIGENGSVIDVVAEKRTISNKIIEEFMLICNKTVAEHAFWANIPFVYRVHETPDKQKIEAFKKFISLFGYTIPGKASGQRLMSLLSQIEGKGEEKAINTLLLRSMPKAIYSNECIGHFGVGASYYCHFTSPIRRYPDLVCHRIIKESINGGNIKKFLSFVDDASRQSTDREYEADMAEREADRIKICEFMEKNVGKIYDATISSVTTFGFFAELDNYVEGLVRVEDIKGDYFVYNVKTMSLVGERTKKVFRIGDKVSVRVARVDVEAGYIDFTLK